jgi:hypothetical protein
MGVEGYVGGLGDGGDWEMWGPASRERYGQNVRTKRTELAGGGPMRRIRRAVVRPAGWVCGGVRIPSAVSGAIGGRLGGGMGRVWSGHGI